MAEFHFEIRDDVVARAEDAMDDMIVEVLNKYDKQHYSAMSDKDCLILTHWLTQRRLKNIENTVERISEKK